MTKDTLFLLHDYADPDHGGESFYCEACKTVEGVLAAYPELSEKLEIVRVPWPRPRKAVVEAIGEDNQNCPGRWLSQTAALRTTCPRSSKPFTRVTDFPARIRKRAASSHSRHFFGNLRLFAR